MPAGSLKCLSSAECLCVRHWALCTALTVFFFFIVLHNQSGLQLQESFVCSKNTLKMKMNVLLAAGTGERMAYKPRSAGWNKASIGPGRVSTWWCNSHMSWQVHTLHSGRRANLCLSMWFDSQVEATSSSESWTLIRSLLSASGC